MTFDAVTRARLVGLFVSEGEETLAALTRLSGALRGGGEAELAEFGRMAHGLKGAAASLAFDGLAGALHALEELALGIGRGGPEEADERLRRIAGALELLGEGLGRMSVSGQDGFPADVLASLQSVLSGPGLAVGAAPPRREDASGVSPPGGSVAQEAVAVERLSVPAADVDDALRTAAALARSAAQLHEALARDGGSLASSAQALAVSAQALEGIISSLRLLPADAALSGLEEEVAELAARLGKRVTVVASGRDIRADRRTLQSARGMLRHLVRNAVDHGIEPPEIRRAAGKDEGGKLEISLEAGESALRVTVADDGAGFDLAAIRQELIHRSGDAGPIASLSDEEALQRWAFEGGSTRSTVTDISGRGLGLSAVAKMARAAGGGIELRSVRGLGSDVAFTLPLEVYAIEILIVRAGERIYGIPLSAVERVVHLAARAHGGVHEGPAGRTLAVGETIVPLEPLPRVLGEPTAPAAPDRFAVLLHVETDVVALAVEEIGAATSVVPAVVPGVAQADALVSGIARLGDGAVLAVLNPRLLLARARTARAGAPRARPPAPAPVRAVEAPRAQLLDVVLADDSLATREVLRVLLEEQGFRVRVAGDGEEALQRVRERLPDVLVSDVNMPRLDGLSLTRDLRRRAETARLPVVLLTSQDDDATRAAGASAGADAYLVKSRFNARVLHETLAQIGVRSRR